MGASLRRAMEISCGLLLITFAVLKATSSAPPPLAPKLGDGYDTLLRAAMWAELSIGALVVVGRARRTAAWGVIGLGVAFTLNHVMLAWEHGVSTRCGCLGDVRIHFVGSLGLSVFILILGGALAGTVGARSARLRE